MPGERSIDDLRGVATHLAEVLHEHHDGSWARMFRRTLADDDDAFAMSVGDALAVLLRHGPLSDIDLARDEVEQLLVDVVATWPPRLEGGS